MADLHHQPKQPPPIPKDLPKAQDDDTAVKLRLVWGGCGLQFFFVCAGFAVLMWASHSYPNW